MRRSDIPVEKVTLNLFKGDAEKVRELMPRLGLSFLARNLIRAWLNKVEGDASKKAEPISLDINLKEMQ